MAAPPPRPNTHAPPPAVHRAASSGSISRSMDHSNSYGEESVVVAPPKRPVGSPPISGGPQSLEFLSLKEINKLCKTGKDVDMTRVVRSEELFTEARMRYDQLFAEVSENMNGLKKLTKHIRREIDFNIGQCRSQRELLDEYLADEPDLSAMMMTATRVGGVSVPSHGSLGLMRQGSRQPTLKPSTSATTLSADELMVSADVSPSRRSPSMDSLRGSMSAPPGAEITTEDDSEEMTVEKRSTVFGVQAVISYQMRQSRVVEQEWKKFELDLYEPLYNFRKAGLAKLTAIQTQVLAKYEALIKHGTATFDSKKTAMLYWNELCECRERFRRATEQKKEKKIKKHRERVKAQTKKVNGQFQTVIENTDKLNNMTTEFWTEVVGNFACAQLEAMEKARCHLIRHYLIRHQEMMAFMSDQSSEGCMMMTDTFKEIVKPTESVSAIIFPILLDAHQKANQLSSSMQKSDAMDEFSMSSAAETIPSPPPRTREDRAQTITNALYRDERPYQYELPVMPDDLAGSTSEKRRDPSKLAHIRDPFKDMLNAGSLAKQSDEVKKRRHTREGSSVRIPSSKAMAFISELNMPGSTRRGTATTFFIDSMMTGGGSTSGVRSPPGRSPSASPMAKFSDADSSSSFSGLGPPMRQASMRKRKSAPGPRASLSKISGLGLLDKSKSKRMSLLARGAAPPPRKKRGQHSVSPAPSPTPSRGSVIASFDDDSKTMDTDNDEQYYYSSDWDQSGMSGIIGGDDYVRPAVPIKEPSEVVTAVIARLRARPMPDVPSDEAKMSIGLDDDFISERSGSVIVRPY